MPLDNFSQRKKAILSKSDKSSKGNWDEKISGLCERINSLDNYYTTSSCAGRVVLIVDKNKKEEGVFRFVGHDLISFEELKNILHSLVARDVYGSEFRSRLNSSFKDKIKMRDLTKSTQKLNISRTSTLSNMKSSSEPILAKRENLNIKFKQEPPILHVACKTLKDAQKFLLIAQRAGWKRSGIIASGTSGGFIVEAISTEKLEFPIIYNGKIIVDDKFLKIIIKKANENLKRGWGKINKLIELIK